MNRRVVGWLAVAAQFGAIAGLIWTSRSIASGPAWLGWVGSACLAIGLAVVVVAFINLGRALTPTPVPNGASLRQGGLYTRIRHPIYTGVLLVTLGLVLGSPGWWPLLWWVVLCVILSSKARWEERMLCERFPQYPDYMRRTGRFLPPIGS